MNSCARNWNLNIVKRSEMWHSQQKCWFEKLFQMRSVRITKSRNFIKLALVQFSRLFFTTQANFRTPNNGSAHALANIMPIRCNWGRQCHPAYFRRQGSVLFFPIPPPSATATTQENFRWVVMFDSRPKTLKVWNDFGAKWGDARVNEIIYIGRHSREDLIGYQLAYWLVHKSTKT